MNRDGSNVRRITNNPAIDTTPTWSPTGTQIAFTSDRSGHAADLRHGRRRLEPAAGSRPASRTADRADLVAGAVQRDRVRRRTGAGLRHQDLRLRQRADAADHLSARARTRARRTRRTAGTSRSRRRAAGKVQIFTIGRDGKGLRQITQGRQQLHPGLVALTVRDCMVARPNADEMVACVAVVVAACWWSLVAASACGKNSRRSRGRLRRRRRHATGRPPRAAGAARAA